MDSTIRILSFALALLAFPAGFTALCIGMISRRVHWLCYPAYFILFGIAGGACLALGLSPSGVAALIILFLITAGSIASFFASAAINARRNRCRFENVAMILGYVYSGLIFTAFLAGWIFWNQP